MARQVAIRIFPDGLIQADIQGIKGKKCAEYIRILEEILEAEAIDSARKPEYFETEDVLLVQSETQRLLGE